MVDSLIDPAHHKGNVRHQHHDSPVEDTEDSKSANTNETHKVSTLLIFQFHRK